MKKILALVIVLLMALGMFACTETAQPAAPAAEAAPADAK